MAAIGAVMRAKTKIGQGVLVRVVGMTGIINEGWWKGYEFMEVVYLETYLGFIAGRKGYYLEEDLRPADTPPPSSQAVIERIHKMSVEYGFEALEV